MSDAKRLSSWNFLARPAVIGDRVTPQMGEHAGKTGCVREIADELGVLVVPDGEGASWIPFWVHSCHLAVHRP